MTTQAQGQCAQNPADTAPQATNTAQPSLTYQQALELATRRMTTLDDSFKLFFSSREPEEIVSPLDCLCVITDAEKLIEAVQDLQKLARMSMEAGA